MAHSYVDFRFAKRVILGTFQCVNPCDTFGCTLFFTNVIMIDMSLCMEQTFLVKKMFSVNSDRRNRGRKQTFAWSCTNLPCRKGHSCAEIDKAICQHSRKVFLQHSLLQGSTELPHPRGITLVLCSHAPDVCPNRAGAVPGPSG